MAGVVDDTLSELLHYAAKVGVELTGIAPRRLPGRGYGIVAMRDIEEGETVLTVPTRALRTLATVPKTLSRRLDGEVSVHGILAAHLALDDRTDGEYAAWDAVLPTPDDLEASMPLLWPAELQALLPSAAREALTKQTAKLERDWEGVERAERSDDKDKKDRKDRKDEGADKKPETKLDKTAFTQAWLLVNSRTFYYATPRTAAARPQRDDHMAMQPVADLFNHSADVGCRVAFGASGFTFVTDRPYAAGTEVPISYGAHADDALLVEYGFVLAPAAPNRWDEVCLDDAVLPRLTAAAATLRQDLADAGFLGRYMVDADTPAGCYRTQVALRRILCGTSRRAAWLRFVDAGGEDGQEQEQEKEQGQGQKRSHPRQSRTFTTDNPLSQARVDALMADCLEDMATQARSTLAKIDSLSKVAIGSESQRDLLARRWRQIEAVVDQAAAQLAGTE